MHYTSRSNKKPIKGKDKYVVGIARKLMEAQEKNNEKGFILIKLLVVVTLHLAKPLSVRITVRSSNPTDFCRPFGIHGNVEPRHPVPSMSLLGCQ